MFQDARLGAADLKKRFKFPPSPVDEISRSQYRSPRFGGKHFRAKQIGRAGKARHRQADHSSLITQNQLIQNLDDLRGTRNVSISRLIFRPMTKTPSILELPLPLVGISDQVTDWLRQAGLPVVRLGQESILKSAFRRKHRSPQTDGAPFRCLLFDSRDLWSRAAAKSHRKQCLQTLDIAKVFAEAGEDIPREYSTGEIANSARFAFLEQLKTDLETTGGVWARLADLPFPYQGVGCLDGELPNAYLPVEAHRLDAIQARYMAGLPSMISAADLTGLAELAPATGLQSPGLPLLWRADPAEFSAWWKERDRFQVKVWQSSTHYHVNCSPSPGGFCPVLEIWRGRHVAGIPLRSESIAVRKEGLVFQQQPTRHPAGFTAGWPDRNTAGPSPRLSA